MISTYREESALPPRAIVPQQIEHGARPEAGQWDQPYIADVSPASWKETFVQTTFRDAPDWVRHVILNSCLKSNLFRDSATSPKLERLARLFGDADLRVLYRDSEFVSSIKFPPGLSSSPVFDETVHADENDFVDCGMITFSLFL